MRLTALDIKKQDFRKGMRGYDPGEVMAFLDMLAVQWQEMDDELRRMESRLADQQAKLDHYATVEVALQEALKTARDSSKQTIASAEQRAKTLLDEARGKARQILRSAETNRLKIVGEIDRIGDRKAAIISRLRAFLLSEIEVLQRFEKGEGLEVPETVTEDEVSHEYVEAADEEQPAGTSAEMEEVEDAPKNGELARADADRTLVDREPAHSEDSRSTAGFGKRQAAAAPAETEEPSAQELEKIRRILDDLE